jgi:hypothetical protein
MCTAIFSNHFTEPQIKKKKITLQMFNVSSFLWDELSNLNDEIL